ncbi:MAG TPA: acyl-CoA dehydrogenase family protein [Vicinamibacterales bacterium]
MSADTLDLQKRRLAAAAAVEVARKFVADVVAPASADLDRNVNPEDCFSWDIVEKGSERGLRTLTLLPEYGGGGADCVMTAMVVEELAKGDMGVSVVFAQTLKLIQSFQAAATTEQRARFLPRLRDDHRALMAIGMTEPQTASNYIIPYQPAGFVTRATRKGNGWIINGRKRFISNGNRARLYLLFAQTNPDKGLNEGSTCFIVERGAPGFTTGHVEDKMGERLANNAELIFDSCFVPDDDVLGEVDRGFDVISQFFPASNAYAAASVLGVAAAAYDRSLTWTRERIQGGQRLIEHDIIAAQLAEMHMLIDAARAYIHHAAWKADHRDTGWDPTLGALPKVFASEVSWKVVTKALELHGAYGYMRDLGFEKLVRDAACFIHSDGVNRTLLLKAAQFIRAQP